MKTKSGRTRRETPAGNGEAFKLEDFLPYRLSVAANRVSRLFARRYSEAYRTGHSGMARAGDRRTFGTLSPSAVGEATAMDKVKVSRAAASLVARGLAAADAGPAGRARAAAASDAQAVRRSMKAWCRWRANWRARLRRA